jgi:preprotein translocase subunit SecA
MAGRGTDIVLGEGVKELGGLHIIGTERHESRRIDNQLRGRSGRQGDPGSSRFYLALDDDLMRLFGSERIAAIMDKLGMEEGEPIENKMVSKAIENSQSKVEGHNFEIRKQLLDYDNVMNQQREVIYTLRRDIMNAEKLDDFTDEFAEELLDNIYYPVEQAKGRPLDEETQEALRSSLDEIFGFSRRDEFKEGVPDREVAEKWIRESLDVLANDAGEQYEEILRYFMLEALDRNWKEHLLNMDHLREGIGLRGYGQKDPKEEYKREGFEIFRDMLGTIKENSLRALCHLRIEKEVSEEEFQHKEQQSMEYSSTDGEEKKKQPIRRENKVGRNDPCPCGSGKKYKKCCGK